MLPARLKLFYYSAQILDSLTSILSSSLLIFPDLVPHFLPLSVKWLIVPANTKWYYSWCQMTLVKPLNAAGDSEPTLVICNLYI